jgi:hypothetical protein
MKVSASVYMTLKVVVHVGDWDAAQPFEQLHKQADREARAALEKAFQQQPRIKICNTPSVMHVTTQEQT